MMNAACGEVVHRGCVYAVKGVFPWFGLSSFVPIKENPECWFLGWITTKLIGALDAGLRMRMSSSRARKLTASITSDRQMPKRKARAKAEAEDDVPSTHTVCFLKY